MSGTDKLVRDGVINEKIKRVLSRMVVGKE